jgi:CheY-like chemotaxis protein
MSDNQKKKIMLVDDDNAIRQLYVFELSTRNFEVVEAKDGKEALTKVRQEKPDLILLDMVMPEMDGLGFLTELKQDLDLKNVPVIMLTNFGQENLIQQAYNLGVTDYLLKYKVTQEEMAGKIEQILSAKTS